MKSLNKSMNQSTRKDVSERPIIPCTRIMPSKKDRLKMRNSKVNHRDLDRCIREGLGD